MDIDLEKFRFTDSKEIAVEASRKAKCHISGYHVGAVLLSTDGYFFEGFNIEFDNFSNTLHAEESAIVNYMIHGWSKKIDKVFIYTRDVGFPCGMCRQSLFELFGGDLEVICFNETEEKRAFMRDILPYGFRLDRPEIKKA